MTSTIEELFRHFVAWKIIHRTEGNAHDVTLSVFAHRNAQAHTFYLQWHIDQAFGIAADEVEALHLLTCKGEDRGSIARIELQFLMENIPREADAIYG